MLEEPKYNASNDHTANNCFINELTERPVHARARSIVPTAIVADLFCGAGGLSLGLTKAGLDVAVGIDNHAPAVATARANVSHDVHQFDLSDVEGAIQLLAPYNPQVLAGGPPCQDFSTAGRRQEGDRADLSHAFVRVGIALGVRYILMENVPRALSSKVYQAALTRLSIGLRSVRIRARR